MSKKQNSHSPIIIWLDVYQRVPHGKNQFQREITVINIPFFVAFKDFNTKPAVVTWPKNFVFGQVLFSSASLCLCVCV